MERFKKYLKAHSAIYKHQLKKATPHQLRTSTWKAGKGAICQIHKESIFIRVKNYNFRRNIGKYILPHIWDRVLYDNVEHKVKKKT